MSLALLQRFLFPLSSAFYFFFLFHPPPWASPFLYLTFSSPFSSEWPDAGNFMNVDLFTFLQSWGWMEMYNSGLLLRGICLNSQHICGCTCVFGEDCVPNTITFYFTVLCVFTVRFDASAGGTVPEIPQCLSLFLSPSLWRLRSVKEWARLNEKKNYSPIFDES